MLKGQALLRGMACMAGMVATPLVAQSGQAPVYVPPAGRASAQAPVYVPPTGGATAQPPGTTPGSVIVDPPAQGRSAGEPPRASPPRPPSAGSSARFRLVASSFTVEHQTVDDMLERDGRGDEVFVRSDWYDYRNRGHYMAHATLRSGVFGDHSDFHAGSAPPAFNSADDQPGGLITGDRYPPRGDNFESHVASRRGDLPMVLWEGTLWRGDAVLIVPSIWEWDSPEISMAESSWASGLNVQARNLHLGAVYMADDPHAPRWTFPNDSIISTDLVQPLMVFDDGTRPIGASVHGPDFRTGQGGMRVPAIVLTYDKAIRAAESAIPFSARVQGPDGTITSSEYFGPEGGFTMYFSDPPQLEGAYVLHLRLERVN